MPRGKHTRLTITLTPAQRATLHAWQRSFTITSWLARRGRIILLVAAGRPITHVARTVGISSQYVYKWVARFQAQGVEGLVDLPRHAAARRHLAWEEESRG